MKCTKEDYVAAKKIMALAKNARDNDPLEGKVLDFSEITPEDLIPTKEQLALNEFVQGLHQDTLEKVCSLMIFGRAEVSHDTTYTLEECYKDILDGSAGGGKKWVSEYLLSKGPSAIHAYLEASLEERNN